MLNRNIQTLNIDVQKMLHTKSKEIVIQYDEPIGISFTDDILY